MTHENEFQSSGTSPTEPDFLVENHGTIFLLQPPTASANSWVNEHLPEDRLTFAGAVVVEHRFIANIVRGAITDGLINDGCLPKDDGTDNRLHSYSGNSASYSELRISCRLHRQWP